MLLLGRYRISRAGLSAALLAITLLACPALTHAQAAEPAPTYQDSTGLTWSVATLELGLMVSAAVSLAASDNGDSGLLLLLGGVSSLISAAISPVAQWQDFPVEPAMVFHHGLSGGALFGLLTFSIAQTAGAQSESSILGLVGIVAGAGAMATYSTYRMERLAHDPQLVEQTHLISWVPLVSAALVSAVFGFLGMGPEAQVIGSIVGLALLGGSIALAEVAIANNDYPPASMEMLRAAPSATALRF